MSTAETVGFSSLGQMGSGMARNLSLSLDKGMTHQGWAHVCIYGESRQSSERFLYH
jgi:hypothetical protein